MKVPRVEEYAPRSVAFIAVAARLTAFRRMRIVAGGGVAILPIPTQRVTCHYFPLRLTKKLKQEGDELIATNSSIVIAVDPRKKLEVVVVT